MRFAKQVSSCYFAALKKEGQPAYDSLPLSHRHVYNHACWHVCIEPKDFPLLFFAFKPILTAPLPFLFTTIGISHFYSIKNCLFYTCQLMFPEIFIHCSIAYIFHSLSRCNCICPPHTYIFNKCPE